MEEVLANWKYQDFKYALDVEIKEAAAGFVRIGYFLKIARDTRVLEESGYTSVADFAKAEYGLSKDVVSRYIAINDKYSENGYSDKLQEKYRDFGVAKLAEMLTLPEAIASELTPDITRSEIQNIKHELKEEENTTDLEIMMEQPRAEIELWNNLESIIYEYMKEPAHYERFYNMYHPQIKKAAGIIEEIDKIFADVDMLLNAIAPTGIANIRVKVPQVGRLMLNITGTEDDLVVINMRSMEKEEYSWDSLGEAYKKLYIVGAGDWKQAYTTLYGAIEENSQVAPVQLPEETAEILNTEAVATSQQEEAENTEEIEPETVENSQVAPVQLSENPENTECDEDFSLNPPEIEVEQEDTATDEEEKKNAAKLHTLKMLEKYYTYMMDDEKEILDRILEDCKRRKREYGFDDVGSTL